MKIFLTGAEGTLGRSIRAASPEEHELIGVDCSSDDAGIHAGSFADEALLNELLPGCDAVIHTAALHGAAIETHTPREYTDLNVGGLVSLLEACRQHGVKRFVFSSTMEIVIGRDWCAAGMAVVDEETAPRPDWIYPANKLAGEQLGRYYHQRYGLEFVSLRYMYFSGKPRPSSGLLARQVMASDVAAANWKAVSVPDAGFQVLHIGPETPLTSQDIVEAQSAPLAVVERYWPGASEALQSAGAKLNGAHFWPVTRISRARQVLGWRPEITFESYLRSLGWNAPPAEH
jgi:nucleoside-diphosphate-sugar epimerase